MSKAKSKTMQIVKRFSKRWFIDAFSGMAQGLFCTLIAGTILAQIGKWLGSLIGNDNFVVQTLISIASMAKMLMGAGIGVGIAHALGANKLTMFSSAVAGFAGAFADKLVLGGVTSVGFGLAGNQIGRAHV